MTCPVSMLYPAKKFFLCFMGLYKIVGNFLIYVNDVEITSIKLKLNLILIN